MWVTIARADSVEELKEARPWIKEAPAGTKGKVTVGGMPWITARIFDLALAEQVFGSHLVPAGATVIDCHEEGGKGYVDFEISGTPIIPLLLAIAAALIALGIFAVSIAVAIQITRISPAMFSWQLWLVIIAAIMAVAVIVVLIARRGRLAAGPVEIGGR